MGKLRVKRSASTSLAEYRNSRQTRHTCTEERDRTRLWYCIQTGSGDLPAARISNGPNKVRVGIARRLDKHAGSCGEACRPAENTCAAQNCQSVRKVAPNSSKCVPVNVSAPPLNEAIKLFDTVDGTNSPEGNIANVTVPVSE